MKQVTMESKDMKVDVTAEYTFCNLCGDQLSKRMTYNIDEIKGSNVVLKDEILKKYEHVHIKVQNINLLDQFILDKDICHECMGKFRDELRMKMETIGFSVKSLGGD